MVRALGRSPRPKRRRYPLGCSQQLPSTGAEPSGHCGGVAAGAWPSAWTAAESPPRVAAWGSAPLASELELESVAALLGSGGGVGAGGGGTHWVVGGGVVAGGCSGSVGGGPEVPSLGALWSGGAAWKLPWPPACPVAWRRAAPASPPARAASAATRCAGLSLLGGWPHASTVTGEVPSPAYGTPTLP